MMRKYKTLFFILAFLFIAFFVYKLHVETKSNQAVTFIQSKFPKVLAVARTATKSKNIHSADNIKLNALKRLTSKYPQILECTINNMATPNVGRLVKSSVLSMSAFNVLSITPSVKRPAIVNFWYNHDFSLAYYKYEEMIHTPEGSRKVVLWISPE